MSELYFFTNSNCKFEYYTLWLLFIHIIHVPRFKVIVAVNLLFSITALLCLRQRLTYILFHTGDCLMVVLYRILLLVLQLELFQR